MIGTAGQPPAPLTPVSAQTRSPTSRGREAVDHGAAEDPAAGMRVPEVEAASHRAARVVGVAVKLQLVREQMTEVDEQLQVVLAFR